MTSTTFTDGTGSIDADWLNDVDVSIYGVKRYGAVGDGVTNDAAAIQSALDAGTGTVYIPPSANNYIITSTLVVPADVVLYIARGAVIECTAAVDAVQILPKGWVTGGGEIYNSSQDDTVACLKMDASDGIFLRSDRQSGASFLKLRSFFLKGIGIYLYSDNSVLDTAYIQWTLFDNINIVNTAYPIILQSSELGTLSFVNGNTFNNIFVDRAVKVIQCIKDDATASAGGNIFNNIQVQCGTGTTRVIEDDSIGNMYNNVVVFDYDKTNAPAVNITGSEAVLNLGRGIDNDEISVADNSNVVHNMPKGGGTYKVTLTETLTIPDGYQDIVVDNTGATGTYQVTLPNTSEVSGLGMEVVCKRTASQILRINPHATDTIDGAAAGNWIQLETDNGVVGLKCLAPSEWTTMYSTGTIGTQ